MRHLFPSNLTYRSRSMRNRTIGGTHETVRSDTWKVDATPVYGGLLLKLAVHATFLGKNSSSFWGLLSSTWRLPSGLRCPQSLLVRVTTRKLCLRLLKYIAFFCEQLQCVEKLILQNKPHIFLCQFQLNQKHLRHQTIIILIIQQRNAGYT